MVAVIGQGPDSQIFKSDSYSTYYGNQDGYSLCKDTYTLSFSPSDIEWLTFDTANNVLSIESADGSPEQAEVTITVSLAGEELA